MAPQRGRQAPPGGKGAAIVPLFSSTAKLMALAAVMSFMPARAAETPVSLRGLDHFYNLEYDPAASDFRAAIAASPGDPDLYNHLAQTLLYRAMYRSGQIGRAHV